MRLFKVFQLSILIMLTAIGCFGPAGASAAEQSIVVGITGLLSGPASSYRSQSDGLKAYLLYVNKHGGVNGYTFNVTELDNQSTAAGGAATVRQLVQLNPLFISIQGTSPFVGTIPILKQNPDLPVLSFGGTQQIKDAGLTNVYGQAPSYPATALFNMRYFLKERQFKNVAIVYENDALGEEAGRIAPDYAKSLGATSVTALPVSVTETNFGPIAARLKNSGAKAVNVVALANVVASLQKAAAAIDYKPEWMTWSSNFSESYLSLAGANAEGTYVCSYLEPIDADTPAAKSFRSEVDEVDHSANNSLGATGWIFGQIAVEAVRHATEGGKALTRKSFQDALNTVFTGQAVGMAVSVRYLPQDHFTMARAMSVYQVHGGKFVRITQPIEVPDVPH